MTTLKDLSNKEIAMIIMALENKAMELFNDRNEDESCEYADLYMKIAGMMGKEEN